MNRLSVETMRELPGVTVETRENHYKPSPAVYWIRATFKSLIHKKPEGFDVTVQYTLDEAIEEVYIMDNEDCDWHYDTATFPQMRTFEELKEVCRLMHIQYPENWP